MSGTTYSKFTTGDKCIIHVDSVNRPTGWWHGTVIEATTHEGYNTVRAKLDGPVQFNPFDGIKFLDQEGLAEPYCNYRVYVMNADATDMLRTLLANMQKANAAERDLRVRLDELRTLIGKKLS